MRSGECARWIVACLTILVVMEAVPRGVGAQSVLERPPELGGTWVGVPGSLYFVFNHRFRSTGAPARKVVNSPTLLLGAALPGRAMVGARYATNSVLVGGYPNEWEFFARQAPLVESAGAPVDLTIHGGYNQAARSWDGELTVARTIGSVRLLAVGRGFSDFRRSGEARWAVAGGGTLRLHPFVAVAGDIATLLDRKAGEAVVWGVGLQLRVPYTPHTLSLQVANTNTTTLEGASIGVSGGRRWGFEFTVPFTLSRYFGGGSVAAVEETVAGPPTGDHEIALSNQLRFLPGTLRIRVGDTVRWRNASDLVHTVTADASRAAKPADVHVPDGAEPFDSGDLKPGQTFSHTFTVPGEYRYFCVPHELAGMVARIIVVKEAGK